MSRDGYQKAPLPTRFFSRKVLLALAAAVLAGVLIWPAILWNQLLDSLDLPGAPLPAHSDAIVSLAGGSGRLDRGLDLLLDGKANTLLLSGTGSGTSLKEIFPDRDLSQLSPGQVILLEDRSTSTYENAIEAWAVLTSRGPVHDVVLLTSNYHMLRAEFVFRKVFPPSVTIHAFPVPAENVASGRWWKDARARKLVLNEYVKYVWYRIKY
jgi:uncharacterized SAM-binding protein YcdF (DUF218 family)